MHFCILNACEHKFLYIVGAGLCCFYATINSLFIHQITKFYVMPARKIFKCILITEFINLVVYHVLFFQNFKILRRRYRLLCFTCAVLMFYVFLYIVSYITYASSLESKVWLDAVTIFQINNMQKGGFLRDNEIILIHQTTNFYATLAPKTFLRILTI